jgi:hypothetical protein
MRFINEQNSQELQISHSLRICFFTELRKVTVGAGFLLLLSHTESAQTLRLASEFLTTRRFLPPGCTSWVPCACSCIHTQNQRNLYHWHPNSCRPDASCRLAVHRGCHALPPALTHRISVFTHRISAISTVGIRIPGGQTLPAARRLLLHSHTESAQSLPGVGIRIPVGQTLPAGGLYIVGARRLLLHSHTESAF